MVAKKKTSDIKTKKSSDTRQLRAIIGLIVNVLFLPGLGSIIGGRTSTGIIQLVLFLVSIPLMFILIGFPLALAMWIWALVTGIQMIKDLEN